MSASEEQTFTSSARIFFYSLAQQFTYWVAYVNFADGILGSGRIVNFSMPNSSATALAPRLFLVLAGERLLLGQGNLPIKFLGATPTQAIFSYSAPDPSPCTVQESTDPAFTTLDHDVDPALFPGSDLDTRTGNFVNGTYRQIVVGFRGTATASDGNTYSRALQAAATHYLKISCDGGSSIGSYTFQTQNPPLGNTAPDYIPFNPANFGNYGWPTIDYTAPASDPQANSYVDPLTGLQLVRWTGPGDGGGITTPSVWYGASDLNSIWANPSNILGSNGYASYSGPGGPNNALLHVGTLRCLPAFLHRY